MLAPADAQMRFPLPKIDIVQEAQERLEAAWAQDRENREDAFTDLKFLADNSACGKRKTRLFAHLNASASNGVL